MKRKRTHRWIVLALFAVSVSGLAALETMAQAQGQAHTQARGQIQGQFFGFGEYTGGTLHTVFELQQGPGIPPRQYTTDITPEDGQYHMTETISATLDVINIQTGLGRRGAAAVAGGRFHFKQTPPIDMSPLGVLAEYGVAIEPNQTYYLPDGASLVTGEIELIAGVEAIKGTFTHPEYPTQRVILGSVIDPAISALLQYPIYMLIEMEGATQNLVQLIEFSFTPEEEI